MKLKTILAIVLALTTGISANKFNSYFFNSGYTIRV